MLRPFFPAVISVLLCIAAPTAADPVPPFSGTDAGPVTVRHGEPPEDLSRNNAHPQVRAFIDDVDALIAGDDAVPARELDEAMARGHELREGRVLTITGTVYLKEALRRLRQLQLDRLDVDETSVMQQYAQRYPERFRERVIARRAADDLGATYGTLAACVELAVFPNDAGPRPVEIEPGGRITASVAGAPLVLDIVPFPGDLMFLRSVTIGELESPAAEDKIRLARFILDNCG